MKLSNSVSAALITSAMVVALSACQKQEGPVEQAGKSVDKAVEKAGDNIRDAAKGEPKK